MSSNRSKPPVKADSAKASTLKAQPASTVRRPQAAAIPWYFYVGVVGVLVVGAVILAFAVAGGSKSTEPTVNDGTIQLDRDSKQLATTGVAIGRGNPNAKVTMVEYSDFECPACKGFYSFALKALEREFVDTNQVYYVYKPHPLAQHGKAMSAAVYSLCLREQGDDKFWKFHDILYEKQEEWVKGDQNTLWATYAQQSGADPAMIQACLQDKALNYEAQIKNNLTEGEDLIAKATNKPANVSGPFTPMVIVGKSLLLANANTEAEYLAYFRNYVASKLK